MTTWGGSPRPCRGRWTGSLQNGHPKWKAVDLNYPLKGWEQYDCVRKYVGKAGPPTSTTRAKPAGQNPVFNAIKGVLDE